MIFLTNFIRIRQTFPCILEQNQVKQFFHFVIYPQAGLALPFPIPARPVRRG